MFVQRAENWIFDLSSPSRFFMLTTRLSGDSFPSMEVGHGSRLASAGGAGTVAVRSTVPSLPRPIERRARTRGACEMCWTTPRSSNHVTGSVFGGCLRRYGSRRCMPSASRRRLPPAPGPFFWRIGEELLSAAGGQNIVRGTRGLTAAERIGYADSPSLSACTPCR